MIYDFYSQTDIRNPLSLLAHNLKYFVYIIQNTLNNVCFLMIHNTTNNTYLYIPFFSCYNNFLLIPDRILSHQDLYMKTI